MARDRASNRAPWVPLAEWRRRRRAAARAGPPGVRAVPPGTTEALNAYLDAQRAAGQAEHTARQQASASVPYERVAISSAPEGETCSICLDKLSAHGDIVKWKHKDAPHYFHLQCANGWRQTYNGYRCPLCRQYK